MQQHTIAQNLFPQLNPAFLRPILLMTPLFGSGIHTFLSIINYIDLTDAA